MNAFQSIALVLILATTVGLSFDAGAQVPVVNPTRRITPASQADDAHFGTVVAMSGNLAVIGAPTEVGPNGQAGSAYVFRLVGTNWVQEQTLLPMDLTIDADFATKVAVDGDTILVGASLDDEFGANGGAAYVFQFDGKSWSQVQKLRAAATHNNDRFGTSLAIHGDIAIIGSPLHTPGGGSVTIFHRAGGVWTESQTLAAPPGTAGTIAFGSTVAMSGDLLAIGAPRQTGGTFGAGAVHTFRNNNGTWMPEQVLLASQPAANGELGYVLACEGDVIAASAKTPASLVGSIDVFHHNGLQWNFEQRIVGTADDFQFGAASAVRDGALYVAAPSAYADPDWGYQTGVVFQYTKSGGTWNRQRVMFTNVVDNANFGTSIATNGEVLFVGEPFYSPVGAHVGAAYLVPISLPDCNANGVLDDCDLTPANDCNGNGTPDECDLISGALHDCDRNGVPDECEATTMYTLDGGNSELVWGLYGPGDFLWLNRFQVQPGGERITQIEIAWADLAWENQPAKFLLYKDPNNDGNPIDAVLLRSVDTQIHVPIAGEDLNFQRMTIPPTFVGTSGASFYVGAIVTQPCDMQYASADYTPPVHMGWRKSGSPGSVNIHDLSVGQYPPIAEQRNWMIRAIADDCDGDGVSNQCEIINGAPDTNANGIPDECEHLCQADVVPVGGNSVVDIDDLVFVITHWGQSGTIADLNFDSTVNIDDLVLLITHWGACP